MKRILILVVAMICSIQFADAQKKTSVVNPNIDMQGYLKVASEAANYRDSRRLTEDDFIRISHEPGTIIPHPQADGMAAAAGGNTYITVSGPSLTAADVARELAWHRRTGTL